MIRKKRIALIMLACVVCLSAYAYGAKSGRGRVVLSTIYFEIGSAEIKPKFENELKKILTALEADEVMGLHIEGYGHQQSASQKDRELSQNRTRAVQQWFSERGIEKSRLAIKSGRDAKPAAQKDGPQDSLLSERVEILQVSLKQPLAFLPVALYEFEPIVEGQEVQHDFIVQNKGSAVLEIRNVKTD